MRSPWRSSAAYTNVAVGFDAEFAALIDGRTSASVWDFGDGVIVSNRPYASHAWNVAGSQVVVLTAYNESHPEGVKAALTVQVQDAPVHYVSLRQHQRGGAICVMGNGCPATSSRRSVWRHWRGHWYWSATVSIPSADGLSTDHDQPGYHRRACNSAERKWPRETVIVGAQAPAAVMEMVLRAAFTSGTGLSYLGLR